MSDVFSGLIFCVSGAMSYGTRRKFSGLIADHGGQVKSSVTNTVTHLITTPDEVAAPTSKVSTALAKDVHIVTEDFIHDSIEADDVVDISPYVLTGGSDSSPTSPPPRLTGRKKTRRRRQAADSDDEDDDYSPPPAKRRRTKKTKKRVSRKKRSVPSSPVATASASQTPKKKKAKRLTSQKIIVPPPHEFSTHKFDGEIYIDDSDGTVYNCMLNQANISRNNNKFYRIQLIRIIDSGKYVLFTHWGRVGVRGQKSLQTYSDIDTAITNFKKKFRAKTGNRWEDRADFVEKSKKYTMIELAYEEKESEDTASDEDEGDTAEVAGEVEDETVCQLDPRVQDLLSMITDVKMLTRVMREFKIDLNRMPLGKLSKGQIELGFEILKDIADAVQRGDRTSVLEALSNEFYTKIPQVFGMRRPPVIDNDYLIREKNEMLETLLEMAVASKIINESKQDRSIHPITAAYRKLRCDIEPVDRESEVYALVEDYVAKTHGPTHTDYELEVLDVFSIGREGERERYTGKYANMDNKMMLWHGSRTTNFVGILSQGLRIAPPSAPVTGYMFGKGVYFADMVSKSANYCRADRDKPIGLALLVEVALGERLERQGAEMLDGKSVAAAGCDSTWGLGRDWIPDSRTHVERDGVLWPVGDARKPRRRAARGSSLAYNEYIVYDEHQLNMQYLVMLQFNYD